MVWGKGRRKPQVPLISSIATGSNVPSPDEGLPHATVSSELTPNLYLKPQRQKSPHLEICSSGFPARALQSMKQIRVVKWLKFSSQVLGHSTGLIPTGGCPTQKCFLLPLCSKSQREPKGSVVTTHSCQEMVITWASFSLEEGPGVRHQPILLSGPLVLNRTIITPKGASTGQATGCRSPGFPRAWMHLQPCSPNLLKLAEKCHTRYPVPAPTAWTGTLFLIPCYRVPHSWRITLGGLLLLSQRKKR